MLQIGEVTQRRDIAYLVIIKVEVGQVGKVAQRGDIAYFVVRAEVEPCQAGEVGQR